MALDRADIERVLTSILARVPSADIRLVGSASSALRGIEISAADIDILFRDRDALDAWFAVLSADLEVDATPTWLADAQQYFARLRSDGVVVELSTVEIETDLDTMECFGAGPWRHFDHVTCGAGTVRAVATELRFITEVARSRRDRYGPILDRLSSDGCDLALLQRGLANVGATRDVVDWVFAELSHPRQI